MAAGGDPCHVVYVAKGHVNATNDGTSWDNAFWEDDALDRGIRAGAAILADPNPPACIDVYVAAGTYKVPPLGYYEMFDRVNIYGGFALGDDFSTRRVACAGGENDGVPCASDADCPGGDCDESRGTIISGDRHDDDGAPCSFDADCGDGNRCAGNYCLIGPNDGSLFVYESAGNMRIDGLVFQSGMATEGGAIRATGPQGMCPVDGPSVTNCLLRNNFAEAGGAARLRDVVCLFRNCRLDQNVALGGSTFGGGAIHGERVRTSLETCTFSRNTVRAYGGIGGAVRLWRKPACQYPEQQVIHGCRFFDNGGDSVVFGGALRHADTALRISTSTFEHNSAWTGGAVYAACDPPFCPDDFGIEVVQSQFEFNVALQGGGGGAIAVYSPNYIIDKSTFLHNYSTYSGGALTLAERGAVTGCLFIHNQAGAGGAILAGGPSIRITGSTFLANSTTEEFVDDASAILAYSLATTIERCSFIANGPGRGVVVAYHSDMLIANSLFVGNLESALRIGNDSMCSVRNSTVAFNNSIRPASGTLDDDVTVDRLRSLQVENSILWGNDDGDSSLECTDEISCGQTCPCAECSPQSNCFTCNANFDLYVSHSLIRHPTCVWPGSNNLNVDPKFMRNDIPRDCDGNGWGDPQCPGGPCPAYGPAGCDDYGDFRLRVDSPCIDAGDTTIPDLADTDLDGAPRVQGPAGKVDIGAYEFSFDGGVCRDDADCPTGQVCCENLCHEFLDGDGDTVADCADQCPGEDDRIDADDNGTPDCAQFDPIPTTSVWGLVVLALLLCISAKVSRPAAAVLARAFPAK